MSRASRLLWSVCVLGCAAEQAAAPCDVTVPGTICTVVGSGLQAYFGDGGPALEAALYVPQDTAIAPDGELWVIDFNNYTVRAVDKTGRIYGVIGTGLLGDSPAPGVTQTPALEGKFNHTPSMVFHEGYLYLAAWHNSRIKRMSFTDRQVENFAGLGKRTFYFGDGKPAIEAALDLPSSVAVDPISGEIVIMDQANQVIRAVGKDGIIRRVAGQCVVDLEVPCLEGQKPLACPNSDKFTCTDPTYSCTLPCTPAFGGDDGPALSFRMAQPYGQAADPAGRVAFLSTGDLLFADTENHRLRKITRVSGQPIEAGTVHTVTGTGVPGYSGEGGPADKAQINRPIDIAVSEDDVIYFTDTMNSCIRRIRTDGVIERVAGKCSTAKADRGFAGDGGLALDAKLNRPYGIDLAGDRLYISDSYNNRIRVVNLRRASLLL